jgi:hypothetical protein
MSIPSTSTSKPLVTGQRHCSSRLHQRSTVLSSHDVVRMAAAETYSRDLTPAPRLIQHKAEAFWFYRFLSIVYDTIVNPGHWTEDMREDALEPAKLDDANLKVHPAGCRPMPSIPATKSVARAPSSTDCLGAMSRGTPAQISSQQRNSCANCHTAN